MAEDQGWVFDSLVCFLHGPIWNAPIQNFIEEKSIVFDPNIQDGDVKPEYFKLHDEYKNLVDYMLGSFMDEMQITPEQFEVACLEGRSDSGESSLSLHQGLFQQIWAANDIRIFVRMMTQRNLEIQLQALDLIERRQNSAASGSGEESVEEQEAQLVLQGEKKTVASSEEQQQQQQPPLKDVYPPVPEEVDVTDRFERLNLFFDSKKVDSTDIKQRQQYLRAQRDRILQIKKQTRARQLSETAKKSERPTSAAAAQRLLVSAGKVTEPIPEASMQLRKTLARRLKTEVVESEQKGKAT